MASRLQNLINRQSLKVFTAALKRPPLPNLIPPILTHLHHDPHINNFASSKIGDSIPPNATPIFPSFPYGFSLNPIYSTGFVPSDANDGVSDEGLWADSVKKKRKRKMNKHKLKKLRKRLRKRT